MPYNDVRHVQIHHISLGLHYPHSLTMPPKGNRKRKASASKSSSIETPPPMMESTSTFSTLAPIFTQVETSRGRLPSRCPRGNYSPQPTADMGKTLAKISSLLLVLNLTAGLVSPTGFSNTSARRLSVNNIDNDTKSGLGTRFLMEISFPRATGERSQATRNSTVPEVGGQRWRYLVEGMKARLVYWEVER